MAAYSRRTELTRDDDENAAYARCKGYLKVRDRRRVRLALFDRRCRSAWSLSPLAYLGAVGMIHFGRGLSFDVAIDDKERINDGATKRILWLDYTDWGDES